IPYKPAEADGMMAVALGQLSAGDTNDSTKSLAAAATAALEGKRDDVFALAALMSAISSAEGGKDEVARTWLALAEATAPRLQGDALLELRLLQAEGIVLSRGGDPRGAVAANEKSLALAQKLYGPDAGLLIATAEQQMALALVANQEYAKARPHLEHALKLIEIAEGPEHVDVASSLGSLAQVYAHTGELAKSRATFDRAIAIREKALGKNSPVLLPTLNNVAEMLRKHGDAAGALPYIERGLAMAQRLGTTSSVYHTVLTTHAQVLAGLGRLADAREELDQAVALEEQHHSSALTDTLVARAEVELAASKWADCTTFAQRAVTIIEADKGKDAPALWEPLGMLGRADVALGKLDDAKPLLERALAIARGVQTTEEELAPLTAALAAAQRR
ncbi:MAG: tetratricopeptide repeat protein, partial [Acidobacteriota bacterium]